MSQRVNAMQAGLSGYPSEVSAGDECRARNDRQTYFSISRELINAQFILVRRLRHMSSKNTLSGPNGAYDPSLEGGSMEGNSDFWLQNR